MCNSSKKNKYFLMLYAKTCEEVYFMFYRTSTKFKNKMFAGYWIFKVTICPFYITVKNNTFVFFRISLSDLSLWHVSFIHFFIYLINCLIKKMFVDWLIMKIKNRWSPETYKKVFKKAKLNDNTFLLFPVYTTCTFACLSLLSFNFGRKCQFHRHWLEQAAQELIML